MFPSFGDSQICKILVCRKRCRVRNPSQRREAGPRVFFSTSRLYCFARDAGCLLTCAVGWSRDSRAHVYDTELYATFTINLLCVPPVSLSSCASSVRSRLIVWTSLGFTAPFSTSRYNIFSFTSPLLAERQPIRPDFLVTPHWKSLDRRVCGRALILWTSSLLCCGLLVSRKPLVQF